MAQSHLSFLKNLTLYNNGKNKFKPPTSPRGSLPEQENHPAALQFSDDEDMNDCDEGMQVELPDANFRKNNIKIVGTEETVLGNQHIVDVHSKIKLCVCGLPLTNDSCQYCEGKNSLYIEGEIFKKQKKENKLKRYWFVLLGKELYCYKNQGDVKHKDMKTLAGVYIKDEPDQKDEQGNTVFSFNLVFPNKRRLYYIKNAQEKEKWLEGIRTAIGQTALTDFYDVGDTVGQGKYGVVKIGLHKRTRLEVAIKNVRKKDLTLKDIELLKREIEVLKVCQHPSINRFYDVFENQDQIQIVMEMLRGGDFFTYLHERKFIISENRARTIAHQICTAIYYLHSFGIAHRDLKPENILMKDKTEDSEIKLVDFGLSKTFGPGETCREPYGTLCYVAPEILLQQAYDKSVDIWSIGIIIYLMLGRHLPFDSPEDKEIARKTISQEIVFKHSVWSTVSNDAKDLILKLLQKNPQKRPSIQEVLDHPWIIGNDINIKELRRKSNENADQVAQFMAYSNTDLQKIQENSPRAAENSTFMQLAGGQIGSLAGKINKESNFVASLKAKEGGAQGGLFGKYKINQNKP